MMDRASWILIAIVCAAIGIVSVAKADATEIVGYPTGQTWVDESNVPTPAGTIVVELDVAVCPLYPGCYIGAVQPRIHLDPAARQIRRTFSHELGHAFDQSDLDDTDRVWFQNLLGTDRPWSGVTMGVQEAFATLYGVCMRHHIDPLRRGHRSEIYPTTTGFLDNRRLARGCRRIRVIGGVGIPGRAISRSHRQA